MSALVLTDELVDAKLADHPDLRPLYDSLAAINESEEFHDEDPAQQAALLTLWKVLEAEPVISREGHLVYAMLTPQNRMIHSRHVPDPATDFVEIEALERVFVDADSVDELMQLITAHMNEFAMKGNDLQGEDELGGPGCLPTMVSEDHPEEWALGFRCVETNTVFVVPINKIRATAIESRWVLGGLMMSIQGRTEIARLLNEGQIHPKFVEQRLTAGLDMREAPKMSRKQMQSARVDAIAHAMGSRFLAKNKRRAQVEG